MNILKTSNFDGQDEMASSPLVPTEEDLAREAEFNARLAKEAEDRKKEYQRKLFESSGVPYRHANTHPEKSGPWWDAYTSLCEKIGSGFLYLLSGPRGVGKSQMGVHLIGSACYKRTITARYTKAAEIFLALRASFRKDSDDSEEEVIKRFTSPRLLVIDAMEERSQSDFEARTLDHIIDCRYSNLDDTLLISNETPESFAHSIGPSVVSRIHECGGTIVCAWPSFREANHG